MPEAVDEITPDIMARYDGLYVNSPRVTAASVARADLRVKIVARHGVGYDSVDVPALAARGVIATNTPVAVRRPVAVAALTFIFALAGRLLQKDRLIRSGRWHERTHWMGQGLTTRTLGVIGAGGIGRELLALARPFGWRMLAADPHVDAAVVQALGAELLPLPQLLQQADFVVATLLLNDATRHLMNAQRFAPDEAQCLFHQPVARADRRRGGADRSAARKAPSPAPRSTSSSTSRSLPDNPLLTMDNVLLTPHALCWTDECFDAIAREGLACVVDMAHGRVPKSVIAVPGAA